MHLAKKGKIVLAIALSFAVYALPLNKSFLGRELLLLLPLLSEEAYRLLGLVIFGATLFLQAFLAYVFITLMNSKSVLMVAVIIATGIGWFSASEHLMTVFAPAVKLAQSVKNDKLKSEQKWNFVCKSPSSSLITSTESGYSMGRKRDFVLAVKSNDPSLSLGRLHIPSCTWQYVRDLEPAQVAFIHLGANNSFLISDPTQMKLYGTDGVFVREKLPMDSTTLSNSGKHAGWLESSSDGKAPLFTFIELETSKKTSINLSYLINEQSNWASEALGFSVEDSLLLLKMSNDTILEIDWKSKTVKRSFKGKFANGTRYDKFVLTPKGWVAWAIAVNGERARIEWNVSGKMFQRTLPEGVTIYSAAVDPQGRYLALNLTSGKSKSSVYASVRAIELDSNKEVFKEFLSEPSNGLAFTTDASLAFVSTSAIESSIVVFRPKLNQ